MKKIVLILLILISLVGVRSFTIYGAPPQLPTNQFTSWSSVNLYSNYYAMVSNDVVYQGKISLYIPPNDFTVFENQAMISYISVLDVNKNLLHMIGFDKFGGGVALGSWFSIPDSLFIGPVAYYRVVLATNYSSTPSGFVGWFNDNAYAGHGDILAQISLQEAYKRGQEDTEKYWATVIANMGDMILQAEIDGYARGIEDYRYYDVETQTYYTASQWGSRMYELGLSESDFSWWRMIVYAFTVPFEIFKIELMPKLYVGYFALLTLVIGVITFFMTLRGKK